jgi:hypothetical protein
MSTTIKTITPKQKLIAKLEKAGGIKANRKALKNLQDIFTEIPKPDVEALKRSAWQTK